MKRNQGFTLIELLAVIIILAVIAIIATPIVLNVVNKAKESSRQSSVTGYADAAKLYVYDEQFKTNGQVPDNDDIKNNTTVQGEKVVCGKDEETPGIYYSKEYGIVLHGCTVGDDTTKYYFASGKIYIDKEEETYKKIFDSVTIPKYIDKSGANRPELHTGLTPVYYDGTNWIVADIYNKWYDYDTKEWANAVTLKTDITKKVGDIVDLHTDITTIFVWVPKYEYKYTNLGTQYAGGTATTPGEITVNFTNSNKSLTDEFKIHPAFTFGETELKGIWVGKFKLTGTITSPTVLPGVTSITIQNVSTLFNTIQLFSTLKENSALNNYGIKNSETDAHMMKNSEWGAVAYLKQSKYGLGQVDIFLNKSNNVTGGGTNDSYKTNEGQSTTGNITGIYDMSAIANEYVMGVYNNMISSSGFTILPNTKYYDNYTTNVSTTACDSDKCYGHALSETEDWYSDYFDFIDSSKSWFTRGGRYYTFDGYSGVFTFSKTAGNAFGNCTARPVLTRP